MAKKKQKQPKIKPVKTTVNAEDIIAFITTAVLMAVIIGSVLMTVIK